MIIYACLVTATISHLSWRHYHKRHCTLEKKRIMSLENEKDEIRKFYDTRHPISVIKYQHKNPYTKFMNDPKYDNTLMQLVMNTDPPRPTTRYFHIIQEDQTVEEAKNYLLGLGHTDCVYISKYWIPDTEPVNFTK